MPDARAAHGYVSLSWLYAPVAVDRVEEETMSETDPFDGDEAAASGSMNLPLGKTCGDCKSFGRCKWLLSREPTETACDWAPSRFRAKDADGREVEG